MYPVIAESLSGRSKEVRVTARPSIEHCHTEKAKGICYGFKIHYRKEGDGKEVS